MNTQFDSLAGSYDEELSNSLGKLGGKNVDVFSEYKIKIVGSKISKAPASILEFGCGIGKNNSFMIKHFPGSMIYGCDISEKSLEIAKKTNPRVQYNRIMSPDDLFQIYGNTFDCIFVSNVFHHIPFNEHKIWINALYNLLSDEGIIFIFEHNPYNPITKHIFNTSKIDRGATMLKPSYCLSLLSSAGFSQIKYEYTLFFLWRNSFFESIEKMLRCLPFGAQYYFFAKKYK